MSGEAWKVTVLTIVLVGAGYFLYYLSYSTSVCIPSRTPEGYLDVQCIRYWNELAQFLITHDQGAFIDNSDDWHNIRNYNAEISQMKNKSN